MQYNVYDIKWDTDGQHIELPTELIIIIPNDVFLEMNEYDIEEYISDEISDITGFCHRGFKF